VAVGTIPIFSSVLKYLFLVSNAGSSAEVRRKEEHTSIDDK